MSTYRLKGQLPAGALVWCRTCLDTFLPADTSGGYPLRPYNGRPGWWRGQCKACHAAERAVRRAEAKQVAS